MCCPSPKWYSDRFSAVYESYSAAFKSSVVSNLHAVPLYKTELSFFELDGRNLKTFVGKDYLDQLLASADQMMLRISLDADERLAEADNRITLVENRVDLVRRDLGRYDHRLDVVVARASEEGDAIENERYKAIRLLYFCLLLSNILMFLAQAIKFGALLSFLFD